MYMSNLCKIWGLSHTLYLSEGAEALKNCLAASILKCISQIDGTASCCARTLSQNIHWIVHLDVHVVTDSGELVLLRRDNLGLIFALDLPAGGAVASEPAGNNNSFTILLWLVGFFALVLNVDGNLGLAE